MTADKGQTPIRLAAGEAFAWKLEWRNKQPTDREPYLHPGGGSTMYWCETDNEAFAMGRAARLREDPRIEWVIASPLYSADTIATLTAQLAAAEAQLAEMTGVCDSYADENQRLFDRAEAAEARVAVAAEDERDRLLVLAEREARAVTLASPVQGGVNAPYHVNLWLAEKGAVTPTARSSIRNLTQETDNAD